VFREHRALRYFIASANFNQDRSSVVLLSGALIATRDIPSTVDVAVVPPSLYLDARLRVFLLQQGDQLFDFQLKSLAGKRGLAKLTGGDPKQRCGAASSRNPLTALPLTRSASRHELCGILGDEVDQAARWAVTSVTSSSFWNLTPWTTFRNWFSAPCVFGIVFHPRLQVDAVRPT
jgi:hypothetical protein